MLIIPDAVHTDLYANRKVIPFRRMKEFLEKRGEIKWLKKCRFCLQYSVLRLRIKGAHSHEKEKDGGQE